MFLRTVKARGKEKKEEKTSIYLVLVLTFQIESQPSSGTYLSKRALLVFRTLLTV